MTKHQKNDEKKNKTNPQKDEHHIYPVEEEHNKDSFLEKEVDEGIEEKNKTSQEDSKALIEAKEEAQHYKDLYIRSQAEMENLRRRTKIELEKASKYAISSFAQDILAVNDNLSRAMASMPEEEKENSLIKNLMVGLEMTQKELDTALEKNNITPIESQGLIFNPNLHKVVQEVEDDTKPAGTIIQEWQKGYMIDGSLVLREAVVIVSKGGVQEGQAPVSHIDTTV